MFGTGNIHVIAVPYASLCNPDSYIHITCYNELISTGIQQSDIHDREKAQVIHTLKKTEFKGLFN